MTEIILKCCACGKHFEKHEAIFNSPSQPKCFSCANIGYGNYVDPKQIMADEP